MKKCKLFLITVLTVILSLFCFAGCFEQGKYEIEEIVTGNTVKEVDNNLSYIELKKGNVAVVSIDLALLKVEGEGTWKKGDEKNQIIISIKGIDYTVVKESDTLTLDAGLAKLVFEKEALFNK